MNRIWNGASEERREMWRAGRVPCRRCGGAGGSQAWRHTGFTCYDCHGAKTRQMSRRLAMLLAMTDEQLDAREAKLERLREKRGAKKAADRAAVRESFLADKPALREALALGRPLPEGETSFEARDRGILSEMSYRLDRFGSLSEKQIAFALSLAVKVNNPKPVEKHVPAPTGRVAFKGTVVSVKEYESDWGTSVKMTVKVETPDGSWLAWMTVPSAYRWSEPIEKGHVVEVKATLEHGKDAHFAFGKRPTVLSCARPAQG